MIGREKLLSNLQKVLDASAADQTEVVCVATDSALTRFANSAIHQNVNEKSNRVLFRSVIGKQVGVASTSSLAVSDLKETLRNSLLIAKAAPVNDDFPGLPNPAKYKPLDTFDSATARYTPRKRAMQVKKVIGVADKAGLTVAGAFSTTGTEVAVLNTNGVRAYHAGTSAAMNIVAMSDDSSGYAAGLSPRADDLDPRALATTAAQKALRSRMPQTVEPGVYEVLLEPAAVASLLEWLNYVGLGSKPFEESTSFLAGKIGRKMMGNGVTLYDNAWEPGGIGLPFDFEGVPRKKVVYVDKGVGKGVVHDRTSARRAKRQSTGHALSATDNSHGAMGLNLCMKAGRASRTTMIEKVKRGILITRFHYINGLIDPPNAVMTGMTRDGTFLVEDGEIQCGLKNLRFTDSLTRAFSDVVAISKERELVDTWWSALGCLQVPAMHLGSFRFSGKTEF